MKKASKMKAMVVRFTPNQRAAQITWVAQDASSDYTVAGLIWGY